MGRSILDAATFEPGRTVTTLILSLALLATIATPALAGPFEEAKAIVSDAKKLATRAAEAEKKFQAAAKQDPKNTDAHYNVGLLASLRGDFKTAERAWTAALAADSGYLAARARLAELQLRNGNEQVQQRHDQRAVGSLSVLGGRKATHNAANPIEGVLAHRRLRSQRRVAQCAGPALRED